MPSITGEGIGDAIGDERGWAILDEAGDIAVGGSGVIATTTLTASTAPAATLTASTLP